ncbi:MAG: hypothetical protein AAFU73_11185 [Planctomycetota bacterium]
MILSALAALAPLVCAQEADAPRVLRSIDVSTSPIFDDEAAAGRPLRQLANATHWTTQDGVLVREIWKRPGDRVDAAFAEELERNLRRTGLFAEAVVRLVPVEGTDEVDLVVRTRDRLSISGGASGSFVGDVTSGGVGLAESNLFGTGDRLSFRYTENSLGETRGSLRYRDRYVAGSWTTGEAELGRTDDGDFASVSLSRPFRYLEDDFAWSAAAGTAARDRDYFANDENVAEVPFDETLARASAAWRHGERFDFTTRGLRFGYTDRDFGAPRGEQASSIDAPDSVRATFLGASLERRTIHRFEEVQGIDTLRFVEDLELSTSARLELGATHLELDGDSGQVQPTGTFEWTDRRSLGPTTYASTRARLEGRFRAGEAAGWTGSARLTAFERRFAPHTLGASAFWLQTDETQGLPPQLTLGEGRGLRGYPARQLTGTRVVGLNLEDRIDLDASLGALDFGAAVFFDVGWASTPGEGYGRPFSAAGFGLRIGSNRLLGRGVARLDVSFPLDDVDGDDLDSPLVSFSLGQAFGL